MIIALPAVIDDMILNVSKSAPGVAPPGSSAQHGGAAGGKAW